MSMRIQRSLRSIMLLSLRGQFAGSEVIDVHIWLSPGLSDAVEASTSGVLSLHRETKFIIGFDFAVTLSSPESFSVFFSTSLQYNL